MITNTGSKVIKESDWKIINKYTARKTKDRNKTVFLKTAIMEKE